ncbi:site-2 protease family protein [Phytomonospora endophytica]|uniref:Zn-dependent protease n=1 Tax=Phytomonospora endophytica TaxID=714109 RepID=A0A841FV28_9ACTN|nr:site-2 protease family protein [Phytomonospora endophytica]MBB6037578.1 Zn-dependent protease [Phytomonospora endophytica]GIG67896.1 site-2 protease family protein [Phytomonospora endophytica]
MSYGYGSTRRDSHRAPSWIFLAFVAAFLATGVALWAEATGELTGIGTGVTVFLFVLAGWVVSLCLHEFGHALTAYKGGDHTIPEKGYLTLNPLKYTHAVLSIILPLVFVILGGIGLPGGAVWVQRGLLRSKKVDSAVSAMGPASNAVFAGVLGILLASGALDNAGLALRAAVAYLCMLQVTATILNLLPIPGLDGYGIIEPWLPPEYSRNIAKIAPFGILLLFVLLLHPTINRYFFEFVYWILGLLGVDTSMVGLGSRLFRFWTG